MQHPMLQRFSIRHPFQHHPFAFTHPRCLDLHAWKARRAQKGQIQWSLASCTAGKQRQEGITGDKIDKQCSKGCTRLVQGLSVALACGLLQPPASLAEQHSGLFAIADMDPKTASIIASILAPVLTVSILLMICRIPLSWYPNLNVKKLPWIIAVAPTEPILAPTRRAIPPVGGVDIAPIIWVSVLTFVNEILLGPQGILNLLQRSPGI